MIYVDIYIYSCMYIYATHLSFCFNIMLSVWDDGGGFEAGFGVAVKFDSLSLPLTHAPTRTHTHVCTRALVSRRKSAAVSPGLHIYLYCILHTLEGAASSGLSNICYNRLRTQSCHILSIRSNHKILICFLGLNTGAVGHLSAARFV
ncbi:hypothetical protein NP493_56g02032 [Ridgeia piscesae]|uniref:Uncharacterized protein n=1 Tax=Ridgeia piscesae TaxID=27915 RepID=A0AAD9UJ02_RIDPI|nr:hypothetical protein NP493_56g02032 [Ridgeia piscesae]